MKLRVPARKVLGLVVGFVPALLIVAGAALLVAGVAMIFVPAGVILAGALLVIAGLGLL